jgi:hypothetical protein
VLQRLNEVNLIKDMGGFKGQVVFPAKEGAWQPPRVIPNIVTAMFFGLLGGLSVACAASYFDKSFRSHEENRLGLAVVGHVPLLNAAKGPRVGPTASALDALLCAYHRPRSREAEAFRGVRTALYFNTNGAVRRFCKSPAPTSAAAKPSWQPTSPCASPSRGRRSFWSTPTSEKGGWRRSFVCPRRLAW